MKKIMNKEQLRIYCDDIISCIKEAPKEGRAGIAEPKGAYILSINDTIDGVEPKHSNKELTKRVINWMIRKEILRGAISDSKTDDGKYLAVGAGLPYMSGHPKEGKTSETINPDDVNFSEFEYDKWYDDWIKPEIITNIIIGSGITSIVFNLIFKWL